MKNSCLLKKFAKVIILIVVFIPLMSGCSLLPDEEDKLAPPLIKPVEEKYDLYKVVKKDIVNEVNGTGNLVSANEKSVSFKKSNLRLDNINVKNGDIVKKGTVLATTDSSGVEDQIALQKIEVQKSQINLQYLKDQYAAYLANPSAYPGADPKAMKKDIEIQQLNLKEANITLNNMKQQYSASILTSPINGIVTFVADLKQGSILEPYSIIVTVSDPNSMQVYYKSDSLLDVKVGMKAKLIYKGKEYNGKVVLSPNSVPANADDKYKNAVLIDVNGLPAGAKLGDSIDIKIPLQTKSNVLVIPKNALTKSAGNATVQITDGNSKKEVNVEIGLENSTDAEIVSGLQEGQMVILK